MPLVVGRKSAISWFEAPAVHRNRGASMGRWGVGTSADANRGVLPCVVFLRRRGLPAASGAVDLADLLLLVYDRPHQGAQRKGMSMKSRKYEQPRRRDIHVAQPKHAERQHARPGAGIKRARAVMSKKPRSS